MTDYMEQVSDDRLLPAEWGGGKYDVSRQLPAGGPMTMKPLSNSPALLMDSSPARAEAA